MRRRDFVAGLGSAVSWPLAARAQEPALPLLGFVNAESAESYRPMADAFRQGLQESGYVEGRNIAIEYRWADGHNERLPAMVADLIRRQPAVIVATSTPAAVAAKAATTTIPIVFETGSDPVQVGLVTSLNRPGGNITGVAQANVEVTPKRLQLLHELAPSARVMALLINSDNPNLSEFQSRDVQSAARTLGLEEVRVVNAGTERDFEGVFEKLVQMRAGGLVISSDPFFTSRSGELAALAVRHAIPTAYKGHRFIKAGGLLSYGAEVEDVYRVAGIYAGRVLKGEKPGNMPIQLPTKVELYINLKTAKALGITVPITLLGRADEVIE